MAFDSEVLKVIRTPNNTPLGSKVYVNGVEFDQVVAAKTGDNGWVEYVPGRAKIKRPEGDIVYTRKAIGSVKVLAPDGAVL